MKTYRPTPEEISQRAREIWNAEGQPVGRDDEIWLAAEQQLLIRGSAQSSNVASTRATTGKEAMRKREEADPIADDELQERIATFGASPSRSATSL